MTEQQEMLIVQIAAVRKQNKELWRKLGYPRGPDDPAVSVLKATISKKKYRRIWREIAFNDEMINLLLWRLVSE